MTYTLFVTTQVIPAALAADSPMKLSSITTHLQERDVYFIERIETYGK